MTDSFLRTNGGATLDRRYALAGDEAALATRVTTLEGKLVAPVWAAFPFAASVSDFGSGFQACKYAIDTLGYVHLRGALKFTGSPASPQALGTLPAGFGPAAQEGGFAQIGTYSGGPIGFLVDVLASGVVEVTTSAGVSWTGAFLSISGITFATN